MEHAHGSELDHLNQRLADFAAQRDWEQFHTPKNLAMALAGEVGELLAELQWLTPEESAAVLEDPELGPRVRAELADVFNYTVRLAGVLGVDLLDAAHAKIEQNARRYPPDQVRGSARKRPALGTAVETGLAPPATSTEPAD